MKTYFVWGVLVCLPAFAAFALMRPTLGQEQLSQPGVESKKLQVGAVQMHAELQARLEKIGGQFKGRLGILVSDPVSGPLAGIGQNERWYLASTTKVLVATEVLRQIEAGNLSYDDTIVLKHEHFRDGAGQTNYQKPGTKLSIRYLMEQMLTESDNAATDLLIDRVGIEQIQNTLVSAIPDGFGPITWLLDVRRHAYGELHPAAQKLGAPEYMRLKQAKTSKEKLRLFSQLTGVPASQFNFKTLREAFESYYAKGYNTATLTAFTQLLTKLARGEWISAFVSSELFAFMSRCQTGQDRIVAGLPAGYKFAHKTGTQLGRICDMGIIQTPANKKLTVAVCAEKFRSDKHASNALKQVGAAIASVF
ncbi:MAG TPA: serine hydrolase [Bdellovibrionales bacterium]|nr:serine hydrolase [Bdellovibrionales bacterium]